MSTTSSPEILDVNLSPGDFYFGQGNVRIHTLLGSCVAITMWHPQRLLGGMCHYLLPRRGVSRRLAEGHFADEAVAMFIDAVTRSNTRPAEYEVKVFGGGNMFRADENSDLKFSVSRSNIQTGLDLLEENGFSIKKTDVGGAFHRKIFIELWNGDVWLQRGKPINGRDVT